MASCSAYCFSFGEVGGIAVSREYHVSVMVIENCVRMCGGVIEELFDFLHCVFCRIRLLRCDGSKRREHGSVGRPYIL